MDVASHRSLAIIAQGDRLHTIALAHTRDVNESRLLVHGVVGRALCDDSLPSAQADLDTALRDALGARASGPAR